MNNHHRAIEIVRNAPIDGKVTRVLDITPLKGRRYEATYNRDMDRWYVTEPDAPFNGPIGLDRGEFKFVPKAKKK